MDIERGFPSMRSFLRLALFFLLFVITACGCVACMHSRQTSQTTTRCPADLFAIKSEQSAPVRLIILTSECPTPYFAKVDFRVENTSARTISRYQVHMFTSYGG